jgi:hypothetical protein
LAYTFGSFGSFGGFGDMAETSLAPTDTASNEQGYHDQDY